MGDTFADGGKSCRQSWYLGPFGSVDRHDVRLSHCLTRHHPTDAWQDVHAGARSVQVQLTLNA